MVEGYRISCESTEMDFAVIHSFITSSYWAKNIPGSLLRKALDNSLCFGVFTLAQEQVGFARVISDFATYGYLSDVFILDAHRGKGLSRWLMEVVMGHAELQGLRRFTLVTQDAQGLYAKFGFAPLVSPESYREIWQPNIYQK